jgi:hypothetical protein
LKRRMGKEIYMSRQRWIVLFTLLLLVGLSGCSSDPPSMRIFNERASKANLQIKPDAGNTFNINDVAGGTGTAYQDISAGGYAATATIQNETVSPEVHFVASENNNYTIVVVNSTPPTLRVDTSEK